MPTEDPAGDTDGWGERRRLEQELAELLGELGDLRLQLEEAAPGLIGYFRCRRIGRQATRLERRLADLQARWAELMPGDG